MHDAQWVAELEVDLPNRDAPSEDPALPATRLVEALTSLLPAAAVAGGYPLALVESAGAYLELSFPVLGSTRTDAFQAALRDLTTAMASAQVEPGPMTLTIITSDEAQPGTVLEPPRSREVLVEIRPDNRYASTLGISDPLARGALMAASVGIIIEVKAAMLDLEHGTSPLETSFGDRYLPNAFGDQYDETFFVQLHVSLIVVGYVLAQPSDWTPCCPLEELALAILVMAAADALEEQGEVDTLEALAGAMTEEARQRVRRLYEATDPSDVAPELSPDPSKWAARFEDANGVPHPLVGRAVDN
jgi:hypothetical protein